MRKVMISLAALALVASAVEAQTPATSSSDKTTTQVTSAPRPTTPFDSTGQVDFGIRGTDLTGDGARFQRYRDLGDGGFLDMFRFNVDNGAWIFEAGADKVGRDDQRFYGEILQVGKLRASFMYDQLPLLYSESALTPYTSPAPGVFRLDQSVRTQLAASTSTSRRALSPFLSPVDLRSSRDTAAFALAVSPSREWDVDVTFNSKKRDGTIPWMAPFGFSNVVELPAPLDDRTNDLSMKAEWANRNGMFRVGYDGSWYKNDITAIEWDNPLAVTDRVYSSAYSDGRAPAFARMATAPDSTQHMVSTAGSYRLPGRSRITGYFGVGSVKSDAAILPFTTNTVAPVFPLDRSNVDGDIRIVSTNFNFTSRPTKYMGVTAKFRYTDNDNRTESFHAANWVNFDGAIRTDAVHTAAHSVKRMNFDADASFTPFPIGAFKVGFGRYESDRTHRIYETTVENVFRTSFDVIGNQYVTLRALYEYSVREGEGLDLSELEHVSEQPGMRHYDIANRDRNRVTALVTVTPSAFVSFNASIAAGKDEYSGEPDADLTVIHPVTGAPVVSPVPGDGNLFGLRDNTNRIYSVGMDVTPTNQVAFGVTYAYENYEALQWSRTANPLSATDSTWVNPARNWSTDSDDTTKTVTTYFDLLKVIPKMDVRFGYDLSKGDATYVYSVGSGVPTAPAQLPPVTNELRRGTVDTKYFLTNRVAVGLVYWYDEYKVSDFAMGPERIPDQLSLPSTVVLGYLYAPYKAHTGMARVSFLW